MWKGTPVVGILVVLVLAGTAMAMTRRHWMPLLASPTMSDDAEDHSDDAHVHKTALKGLILSDGAKASLGLELGPIVLQEYWRSIPIPAEVMEEPGHCELGVSSHRCMGSILKHPCLSKAARPFEPVIRCSTSDRPVNCWPQLRLRC